jgi:hypothetical protein
MSGARAALRVAAVGLALALFPSAVGAEEPAPATDAPAVDPATGDEVGLLPAGDGSTTTAAVAVAASVIEVSGHGFGHGRGMGQYGALGYSLAPFNWPASRILQHYYSNTAPGNVGNGPLDVVLSAPGATTSTGMSGSTIVRLDRGNPLISVNGAAPFAAPAQAVQITRTGNGFFQIRFGASCTGPWGAFLGAAGDRMAVLPARPPGDLVDALQVCDGAMTGGNPADRRWVRGEVQAVSSVSRQYTVNRVFLDAYLQGVVPRESPASWPAAALQAQSVAARSYALADARTRTPGTYPWVATCDTISCQVYGGRQQQRGGIVTGEVASTDSAVAATSGQVRLLNNVVARTEFSSSTGGWSAGGTFPAVEDLGDATPSNSRHDWRTTIERSAIEASFARGGLEGLEITRRNGLGADGGRVLEVTLRFVGGATETVSGNDFRIRFRLFSDWFSISGVTPRFSDTAGHTHAAAIEALASRGIVNGGTDGRFRPDDDITRGQLAAILVRAYALTGTHPNFCDTAGHTFEREIRAVAAAGIALGSGGCFNPDGSSTRAQMAGFIARAEALNAIGPGFCDTAGHPLETPVRQLQAAAIALGQNGCFGPDDSVTRGQTATFVARALGLV